MCLELHFFNFGADLVCEILDKEYGWRGKPFRSPTQIAREEAGSQLWRQCLRSIETLGNKNVTQPKMGGGARDSWLGTLLCRLLNRLVAVNLVLELSVASVCCLFFSCATSSDFICTPHRRRSRHHTSVATATDRLTYLGNFVV